jgi:hypothetical protein
MDASVLLKIAETAEMDDPREHRRRWKRPYSDVLSSGGERQLVFGCASQARAPAVSVGQRLGPPTRGRVLPGG